MGRVGGGFVGRLFARQESMRNIQILRSKVRAFFFGNFVQQKGGVEDLGEVHVNFLMRDLPQSLSEPPPPNHKLLSKLTP